MPYFRVYIDNYMEEDFESIEQAKETYLEFLREDVDEHHLTVEVFNEESGEWE